MMRAKEMMKWAQQERAKGRPEKELVSRNFELETGRITAAAVQGRI